MFTIECMHIMYITFDTSDMRNKYHQYNIYAHCYFFRHLRHGAIYVIYIQPSYTFDTSDIPLIFFAFIFCTVFILHMHAIYLDTSDMKQIKDNIKKVIKIY